MLSGSLPTGTVSTPDRRVDEAVSGGAADVAEATDAADAAAEVATLRDELDRRRRERHDLVRQYERLLAERDERIAALRAQEESSLRERLVARLDPRR